jgi:hypothetical protein
MTTKFNPLAKKGFDKIGMSEAEVSAAHLKLDQTTPQTITGGIPLLTGLTPTTDYQIATKKYVDDNAGGTTDDSDIAITRSGGEITRLDWESGRSAVFNRTEGVLNSVIITCVDGRIITKTINRTDGIMTGITTAVQLP